MSEFRLILERLHRLVAEDRRPITPLSDRNAASSLFSFVTHRRERIAGAAFSRLSIVVIVEGSKEVLSMGRHQRLDAGTVLVLPSGWRGEVVNDPDPASGAYRAIFIDFPDALVRRAETGLAPLRRPALPHIALDATLAEAIRHAGDGIMDGNLTTVIAEHRVLEILMVLAMRGALPARADTTSDAIRALVRWQPDRAWTADLIATELGTSNATLRRRLGMEGTSLRAVIAGERMALAEAMLAEDGLSLREAALATGYRSPRRFAERRRALIQHGTTEPI
ncbi:helix-turn-helix transcriptional regulator [Rhizobium tumorigenes]|uniref:helix-turn-helix transcriptional regulator n=1 Tax=Rhizobium tumorigenes TaxID=2041385 RepID=UPI00241CBFD9|nr:AraC family transcriptional regulator [Rhizobium tumorigenes]WFS01677.1 AraC family transcriptional regulator [Rhizobium tumorigenes]